VINYFDAQTIMLAVLIYILVAGIILVVCGATADD
jgi:hypothetical protein